MDAIIILNDDTVMHVVILDSDPSEEELNEMVKLFRGNRYICATMDHALDFGSLKALYEEMWAGGL